MVVRRKSVAARMPTRVVWNSWKLHKCGCVCVNGGLGISSWREKPPRWSETPGGCKDKAGAGENVHRARGREVAQGYPHVQKAVPGHEQRVALHHGPEHLPVAQRVAAADQRLRRKHRRKPRPVCSAPTAGNDDGLRRGHGRRGEVLCPGHAPRGAVEGLREGAHSDERRGLGRLLGGDLLRDHCCCRAVLGLVLAGGELLQVVHVQGLNMERLNPHTVPKGPHMTELRNAFAPASRPPPLASPSASEALPSAPSSHMQ